jgi:uncharacterized protein YndB with AHSA1/START domain
MSISIDAGVDGLRFQRPPLLEKAGARSGFIRAGLSLLVLLGGSGLAFPAAPSGGSVAIDQPINAAPMLVWTMVGSARGWERWFCDQARFVDGPPETGKPVGYEFRFAGLDAPWRGSIYEYVWGRSIGMTWDPPAHGDFPAARGVTSVRIVVDPQGKGALVRLTQSGFTDRAELLATRRSWLWWLHNLQSVAETGRDLRR